MKPSPDHQVRIVKAALKYVERGWMVFPAPPNGKKQGLRSRKDNDERWGAVRTAAEVNKVFDPVYLRRQFHLSKCNIGVCTGAASGIVVLDVDTAAAHGKDGVASLRALEKQHGKLPKTKTAITPSGGLQMFFQDPDSDVHIPCSASKLGDGIDIKGDGGMVIGPPSWRRGKGFYRWGRRRGDKIARMPDWLVALVTADARHGGPKNAFEQMGDEQFNPTSIAKLKVICAGIPNADGTGRDEWVRVGFAIRGVAPDEDGFAVFDAWSRKWPGYDAEHTRRFWDTAKSPDRITAGTLYHLAEQAMGEDWQERFENGDPEIDALVEEFLRLMGGDE